MVLGLIRIEVRGIPSPLFVDVNRRNDRLTACLLGTGPERICHELPLELVMLFHLVEDLFEVRLEVGPTVLAIHLEEVRVDVYRH